MKTHPPAALGALVPAFALLLGGASASRATAQEAGGDLHICALPDPGFFARDTAGAASGFEYDLLAGFAAAAKVKATFEDVAQFDKILTDTASGRCQIGAATISVTDERKARMAFSIPYFPNRVVVVQKAATGFTQPADLKDKKVAVVKGTVSIGLVGKVGGAKPVLVDRDEDAFKALLSGSVDAAACDSAIVLYYLKEYPDLAIAFPIGERSFFAFALPSGSKFLAPLNDHLRSLLKSGAFAKLLAKHFGEANAEMLAEDVTKASAR
jgi:ABC-type amino acid transport substrate-binding protein